jgi:hypothetical protein
MLTPEQRAAMFTVDIPGEAAAAVRPQESLSHRFTLPDYSKGG